MSDLKVTADHLKREIDPFADQPGVFLSVSMKGKLPQVCTRRLLHLIHDLEIARIIVEKDRDRIAGLETDRAPHMRDLIRPRIQFGETERRPARGPRRARGL